MEKIYSREQIAEVVSKLDIVEIIDSIADGFVAYSQGKVVVPPVGELIFSQPPGETHIKYGYIRGDDCYVIKIASGFYENIRLGLPANSGLMLIFSQKTGHLESILLDEGHLTNIRTAAAGAVAARCLAPSTVERIGIVGTGCQGKIQLEYLQAVTDCRKVLVWGRSREKLAAYIQEVAHLDFNVQVTLDTGRIAATCNLIVTATASRTPLLDAGQVRPGTHITAIGSDTPEKQELDPGIIARADLVVTDSLQQSQWRGEIFQAREAGLMDDAAIYELGQVISGQAPGRTADRQVTVADLTGVAVQDIQICKLVAKALA